MPFLARALRLPYLGLFLAATGAVLPAAEAPAGPETSLPGFRRHHFVAGAGTGATFERDIFNTGYATRGHPAKTDPALRLAYHYNVNASWSIGIIVHGYRDEFTDSILTFEGPAAVDFALATYNRGLIVQRYFSRGQLQPYVYGMLTLASGKVKASYEGGSSTLGYDGYSFGGGGGVLAVLYKYLGVSLDGGLSLGRAEWEEAPFQTSDGDGFSPSYWAVTANAVLLIP